MIRRIGAMAIIAAFVLLTGHTAEADNATALPQGKSFFEGTWVGKWQSSRNPGDTKDVTLIINKGNAGGVFLVDFSWGPPPTGTGFAPAGSLKAEGREEGDKFVIKWKNKSGDYVDLTLKKVEDNKVVARQKMSGFTDSKKRPYTEIYLNRQ